MYFKNFNNIQYDFTINTDVKPKIFTVQDLTTRVTTYADVESLKVLCIDYIVSEFERPETIAFNMYKNPVYHWTILYINGITNMQTDWPINGAALSKYVIEKYGQSHVDDPHHCRSISTGIVGTFADLSFMRDRFGFDDVIVISNNDHEIEENEIKRNIKIINPRYVADFIAKFNEGIIA